VAIGFGVTAIAAVIDMQIWDTLGLLYQIAYVVGCVAAVCLVRRRSLFGPIVQPPLVFALTAVVAVLALGEGAGNGFRQRILSVALSLTSNFPTMAIATGVTVAIGLYRLWKERDPNPPVRATKRPAREGRSGREPEAARRERAGASGERRGRPRPSGDEAEGRRGQRERPAREKERREGSSPRERGSGRREPGERGAGERRARPRDQESPGRPRRESSEGRPRRDDRGGGRREPGQRQPRRRPPDSHR